MHWLVLFPLPTAMSSLTGNHTMDLLYLLKKNFENLLFELLITGRSFDNLSYLRSFSSSRIWRFWRIHSNVLQGIESDLAYTKVFGVASHYILWTGSSWYPVRGSTLRNKQYFFISNFKINGCFLDFTTWCSQESYQLNVTKNNSRSLRGVIKSSSATNFGMFAHSPTLISRFAHFISKTGGFG